MCDLVNLIMRAKNKNTNALAELLIRFEPLIINYSSKLYNMEFEDAKQELTILLIQCIHSIKRCDNDNECLAYIKVYIYHGFCKIYQEKKRKYIEEVIFDEELANDLLNNDINDCTTKIDLEISLKNYSERIRKIIYLVYFGYSDKEIAMMLSLSRQYINRIKKEVIKNIQETQKE